MEGVSPCTNILSLYYGLILNYFLWEAKNSHLAAVPGTHLRPGIWSSSHTPLVFFCNMLQHEGRDYILYSGRIMTVGNLGYQTSWKHSYGQSHLTVDQRYYNVSQKKDVKENTFVDTKMLSKGTATQSGLYCCWVTSYDWVLRGAKSSKVATQKERASIFYLSVCKVRGWDKSDWYLQSHI